MTKDPTDAEAILSSLDHATNWLIETSNKNPLQFLGHEEWLYSIMNRMQFVASRFSRVYNDNKSPDPDYERDLDVLRKHLNREEPSHAE